MKPRTHWLLLLCGLLLGCGTPARKGPLDYPTPVAAAAQGSQFGGQVVEWGGVITGGGNRADRSWLEILAYPLSDEGRPLLDLEPVGRFRAFRAAYIETADFAPGRVATVRGPIRGIEAGQVGSAGYDFPLVEAQGLRLWRETTRFSSAPDVQFGIGIGIGSYNW